MQIDFKKLYDDIKVLEQNCPTIKLPISIDKNMFKEQVGKIASPKISTQLKIERQKFRDEITNCVGQKETRRENPAGIVSCTGCCRRVARRSGREKTVWRGRESG